MNRIALITGIDGQDGYYLGKLLGEKGYQVVGSTVSMSDAKTSGVDAHIRLVEADLMERNALVRLIAAHAPSEVYHLAAPNFSSSDARNVVTPVEVFMRVNAIAVGEALEFIRTSAPKTKLFFASSCHVFGEPQEIPQLERTAQRPESLYAISKACGANLCRYFRSRGVFAAVGILFNHESPRRADSFVSAVLARAAARVGLGRGAPISLRDPHAVVDWGAAPDYVDAMWRALQAATADDYVVATGRGHTVMEFADEAFAYVGAVADDWIAAGTPASDGVRRLPYVGDASRLRAATGWEPRYSFRDLVHWMVETAVAQEREAHVFVRARDRDAIS